MGCLCRPKTGQHRGPRQKLRQGQAASRQLSDLTKESSQEKRHKILQVDGSNNKTCIIAQTVQTLREDHRHHSSAYSKGL